MTAEDLVALRAKTKMTQQDLADFFGVDIRTVQRYLVGDTEIAGPVLHLALILRAASPAERHRLLETVSKGKCE